MFEKVICFTDLHFGEKQNSKEHNQDCIEYLKWMIGVAKERGITEAVFLGDWHHSRRAINVETLHYSVEGLNLINTSFDKVWFLEGNHDLFYRESRDISSVSLAATLSNIEVISETKVLELDQGKVAMVPWLVKEEWKELKNKKYSYVFGHFELPTFLLNAMIRKPDTGELSKEMLSDCGMVFSGHFHKRQNQGNVWYIGNAFPHNFNDVDDKDRGCMILEWGNEPEFVNWEDAPTYRRWELNDLIENPDAVIGNDKKIHAEVFYGGDTSYAQASHIRENLMETYDFRAFSLKKIKDDKANEGSEVEIEPIMSLDRIVIDQLMSMDSESLDTTMLVEEYQALDSYDK